MKLTFLVINSGGHIHLDACLESLQSVPPVQGGSEILVVDNASPIGTRTFMKNKYSDVRVRWNSQNEGFPKAVNQGFALANGDFVFLMNNDITVRDGTVPPLLAALEDNAQVVAVAPKMFFASPIPILDSVGTVLCPDGYAINRGIGQFDLGQYDRPGLVFGACFGAVMVRKEAFHHDKVGPLDEGYFLYFEDVDWCLRANLLGFDILAEPRSHVVHIHSASTRKWPSDRKFYLGARNVIKTIAKNYQLHYGVLAFKSELQVLKKYIRIPGYRLAAWSVLPSLVPDIPRLFLVRNRLARAKVRSDSEVFRFATGEMDFYDSPSHTVRNPVKSFEWSFSHALSIGIPLADIRNKVRGWLQQAENSGFLQVLSEQVSLNSPLFNSMKKVAAEEEHPLRKKVAIITTEVIEQNMAGPGIRALEIARALAPHLSVTLVLPATSSIRKFQGFKAVSYCDDVSLRDALTEADSFVIFGFLLKDYPLLRTMNIPLVVDSYSPFVLEALELYRHLKEQKSRERLHQEAQQVWSEQLMMGDFIICASERQRDGLLGALTALGRVNPDTYNDDPTFRRLIDVVPFGIPAEPPKHTRRVLKGVHPGIADNDHVLLWGGGIWDWLDPITAIRAVEIASEQRSSLRLFFMGTRHPNPATPPMRRLEEARRFALDRRLEGQIVFFNEWVPYEDRQNYLLEADLGVSAHFEHTETRFSFRTRLLDCIWAGLPIVCSSGDFLGEIVEKEGLGKAVAPGDFRGMAKAILRLLDDKNAYKEARERLAQIADKMTWDRAVMPLIAFCNDPHRAPDHLEHPPSVNITAMPRQPGEAFVWAILKAADTYLRAGPREFLNKTWHKSINHLRRDR